MNPSMGVIKQMEWEQQAASKLGARWTCVLHTPLEHRSPIVRVWRNLPRNRFLRYTCLRKGFYRWLEESSKNYDLILLRFSVHDPWQAQLVKRIGQKVVTVHHTKEGLELRGTGTVGYIRSLLEHHYGSQTLAHTSAVVGVTNEILEYEERRGFSNTRPQKFLYPNGVICRALPLEDNRSPKTPELLFIASYFSPWHGLDRILRELKNHDSPCILNIAGRLSDGDLSACQSEPRIRYHGAVAGDRLNALMSSAWCGLSSFALDRTGMQEACTLKVREYLDAGVAVYAGHRDVALPDQFPYYRKGATNLSNILQFATDMKRHSREDVSSSSRIFISKIDLFAKLHEQLCEWYSGARNTST